MSYIALLLTFGQKRFLNGCDAYAMTIIRRKLPRVISRIIANAVLIVVVIIMLKILRKMVS